MGETIKNKVREILRTKKLRRRWIYSCLSLSLIVVLIVNSELALGSIAMSKNAGHKHTEDCYAEERNLICGQEESDGHVHSDDCYTKERGNLICGQEESEDHTHTDECYEWNDVLTCGKEEGEDAHHHTDACYEINKVLVCGQEESAPVDYSGMGLDEEVEQSDGSGKTEEAAEAVSEDNSSNKEASNDAASKETAKSEADAAGDAATTATKAEEAADEVKMPAVRFEEHTKDVKVIVEAEEGTFPEGTTMVARQLDDDDEDVNQAVSDVIDKEKAEDNIDANEEIKVVKAVDITFRNKEGEEIEPLRPVRVFMTSDTIKESENVVIVHLDDEEEDKNEVIKQKEEKELKKLDIEPKDNQVVFDAEKFSKYVIVGTEVLTGDVITADGSTYTVTVRYTADARIPSGAELKVSEITEESEKYAQYAEEAARTIYGDDKSEDTASVLPYVRFFDISILNGESEIEPAAPVQVEIALKDGAIDEMENGAAFSTVHFTENGAEKMTIDVADSVKFETDSFSVYGVAYTYTVDFYYEQAEYHLDGGNEMLLSALFAELGVERNADEAQEVVFSTPSLVRVEKKDGQWNLVSLMPFLSAETLTVTFPDGEVIVIYVTDATTWTPFGTNCEWRLVNGVLEIRAKAANATMPSFNAAANWPWNADRSSITSARFVQNGSNSWKVNAGTNMGAMLANCPNLTNVDFSYLDTSTCTNSMWGLFQNDSQLTSITWGSSFDISKVKNIRRRMHRQRERVS